MMLFFLDCAMSDSLDGSCPCVYIFIRVCTSDSIWSSSNANAIVQRRRRCRRSNAMPSTHFIAFLLPPHTRTHEHRPNSSSSNGSVEQYGACDVLIYKLALQRTKRDCGAWCLVLPSSIPMVTPYKSCTPFIHHTRP